MKTIDKVEQKTNKLLEKGAGLDMSHLSYCPKDNLFDDFGYLHTSIRSNNDQIISEVLEDMIGKTLVTEINFVDKISVGLLSHLVAIGREWVDILEIPASCNWTSETASQLKYLLDSGMIYDISIKNPETIERLKEILDLLELENIKVRYISLDICPLNFEYSLIKEAEERELKIIGYNPMGGHYSSAMTISCFSAPYLLSFAATYCSIVFVSSRDFYKAIQDAKYLNKLYEQKVESIYILKKNVHKLVKPLKQLVYTSIILDDNVHLPYYTPDLVPTKDDSIVINLGKEHIEINENIDNLNELEKEIMTISNKIAYPLDSLDIDKFAITKNQIIGYLKTKFSSHLFYYSIINNTTVAIKAQKETTEGWFKKTVKKDNHEFIISMMPGGKIYFREVSKMES